MSNRRNQPLVGRARRWGTFVGMGAGAVVAAAMIGVSGAADAHADTGGDVLGQAGTDLTDATQVLDGALRRRWTPKKPRFWPIKSRSRLVRNRRYSRLKSRFKPSYPRLTHRALPASTRN
jgi:hypothetical protein